MTTGAAMGGRPRQNSTGGEPVRVGCCECGQVMAAIWQPGYGELPGHWLITCENLACDLWGQTATPDHYPPADLDSYLRYGRAHRRERQARRQEGTAGAAQTLSFENDYRSKSS